jgi:hypothetical protein
MFTNKSDKIFVTFVEKKGCFMMKVLEALIVASCCYGINCFVNGVLDPDYTKEWQSREEWKANGSIGGVPRDKDAYKASIMQRRSTDKPVFFFLFAGAVAGYYFLRKARKEMKLRTARKINTIANNRKIVGLRTAGLFFLSIFAIAVPLCLVGFPVENANEAGKIGLTYPFGDVSAPVTAMVTVGLYLSLAFGAGPFLIFRKLTDAFSFKFCLMVTLTLIAIIVIAAWLGVPRTYAPLLGNLLGGIPLLRLYARKMEKAAKIIGM